ncbi:MAG: family 78 glycoside hydrolase catalytic domain [Novosphingobium sp.]
MLRDVMSFLAGLAALGATAASAEPQWVTHPGAAAAAAERRPIVLQFRKTIDLISAPRSFFVRVSADNRYVLYVNGMRVDAGPSRGDLAHWRYRRIDIAKHLRAGGNVIAAHVWNAAGAAPVAQMSARTGFWLDAEGDAAALDSGSGWQVRVDPSRRIIHAQPVMVAAVGRGKYYAGSAMEAEDKALAVDWLGGAPGADWVAAVPAVTEGALPWTLVEDRLPQMRYALAPIGRVVRAEGIPAARFPGRPLTIPTRSTAILLIDTGRNQAAFPELTVSGGKGAELHLSYAEALYDAEKNYLANRSQIEGGTLLGLTDTFKPDGGANRAFHPLWWRTWRFVELKVTTGDQPLVLNRFVRHETGYPFVTKARFVSDDPELNRIWQVGWDTVRLDAHETFMDTAYWEQLQYAGDTRIEALASYAVSGDGRLGAQALDAFAHSAEGGLPKSRYPSSLKQSIPPFALLWIGMLHDYWTWQRDVAPVRRNFGVMRSTLDWYAKYVGADGLVGTTPGWEFIDWRLGLDNYPQTRDPKQTERCIVSLFYLGALRQAADLEDALGEPARLATNRATAAKLAEAIQRLCWSAERGLYADQPDKTSFSQHANALAVLYDVAPQERQREILERITVPGKGIAAPEGITPTTYYFAFYLVRAFDHAGLADRYPNLLKTWRDLLGQNFTTWPETPDPSRSDSHAWTAHPTADLLGLVAGIRPAAPGFARVGIEPHLGRIGSLDAAMPHPAGLIQTRYRRVGNALDVTIVLPAGLFGDFVIGRERRALKPGVNRFSTIASAER